MLRTGNRFRIRAVKAVAKDATATLTSEELGKGLITSTSAAATTLTLPTASALSSHLKPKRGDKFEFIVDNSDGDSTVTVAVGTGITAATAVLTGSATLTIVSGSVGHFVLYFTTATTAILYRQL